MRINERNVVIDIRPYHLTHGNQMKGDLANTFLNNIIFPTITSQPQVEVTLVRGSIVPRNNIVILADGLGEVTDVFEYTCGSVLHKQGDGLAMLDLAPAVLFWVADVIRPQEEVALLRVLCGVLLHLDHTLVLLVIVHPRGIQALVYFREYESLLLRL